eukprot:259520_1
MARNMISNTTQYVVSNAQPQIKKGIDFVFPPHLDQINADEFDCMLNEEPIRFFMPVTGGTIEIDDAVMNEIKEDNESDQELNKEQQNKPKNAAANAATNARTNKVEMDDDTQNIE